MPDTRCFSAYKRALEILCCRMPRELALIVLGYWGLPRGCSWHYTGHDSHKDWFECYHCGDTDWR